MPSKRTTVLAHQSPKKWADRPQVSPAKPQPVSLAILGSKHRLQVEEGVIAREKAKRRQHGAQKLVGPKRVIRHLN